MRPKNHKKLERGQAIVLIAFAIIGLIAMIGLMIDGGMLLIEYGRLKRAIDAASLSAALQYREGYTTQELTDAATEFLQLNQSNIFNITIDTDSTDSSLLFNPRRKMVRVTASRHVRFSFLSVIGIRQADITATSVGEAASVDVVIVLDASASMSFEGGGSPTTADSPLDDPSQCNPTDTCHPFAEIKDVAVQFVNQLYFPYDRVAIITFDRDAHEILRLDATNGMDGDTARATIVNAINHLNVFDPGVVCADPVENTSPITTHCRNYKGPGGTYNGTEFPLFRIGHSTDPSSIPSSNIGDALWLAGNQFAYEPIRQDSLWVVIVLAGGPTNTGCTTGGAHGCTGWTYADGRVCPPSTWLVAPSCREGDVSAATRHAPGHINYDSDDYARDAADFIANPLTGQGATIFSIGLGAMVRNTPAGDPRAGEKLLNYAATVAGDESGVPVNHGLYFFAPETEQLREVFRTIAENIATRLSQ